MKKDLLKVLVCFIATLMLFTGNVFAFEQERSGISPRWASIYYIDLSLDFSENIGYVAGSASKKPGASMIEGTLYVYEKVNGQWEYIDEAYKSKTVGTLGITIEFDAQSGVEYKAVFVVTAYTNGVAETETVENIKTCP